MPPVVAPRLLRSPIPPVPAPIALPMIPPVLRPKVPPSLRPPVPALRPRPVPTMPPVLIPQPVVSRVPPVPARVAPFMPPVALPTPPPVPPVPAPMWPLPIANGTCLGAMFPKPVPATPPPPLVMEVGPSAAAAAGAAAAAPGAWARAGTEELPIKTATAARVTRYRICLSVGWPIARLWNGFCTDTHRMTALLRRFRAELSRTKPANFRRSVFRGLR